jgi:hypothetical protein
MSQIFRKITLLAAPLLIVLGLSFATLTPVAVQADDPPPPPPPPKSHVQDGLNAAGGSAADYDSSEKGTFRSTLQKIINILLFIIGIIAVIVIVISGIQYVTSGGNAEQASKAKNGIIFAVVGIIVAVMAYAIVGFVVDNI